MTSPTACLKLPNRLLDVSLVIWDLDETVWSRKQQTKYNGQILAGLLGISYEELDVFWHGQTIESVFSRFEGKFDIDKARDFTTNVSGEIALTPGMTPAELAKWYSAHLDQVVHSEIQIPLMKGAQERFNELESLGVSTAIVTSADSLVVDAVEKHTNIGLPETLHRITADVLDGNPGKPHPYAVLRACELANVEPRETVFIGDSMADVLAGWLSGARVVNVRTGPQNLQGRLSFHKLQEAAFERGLQDHVPNIDNAPEVFTVETLDDMKFLEVSAGM